MTGGRTAALAITLAVILASATVAGVRWPESENALDCPPTDVRWMDAGTNPRAVCAAGTDVGRIPAAQAMTIGLRLDLNRMSEAELTLVPGIGRALARAIVDERERRGGFRSWSDVDRVRGVGPAKVEVLQSLTEIR